MKVLGVDPGLRVTGYGVISVPAHWNGDSSAMHILEAGIVNAKTREGISERLRKIFQSLKEVIEEFKPDVLAIEKLYTHYEHPATAILMGHARGVVCLLSGIYGLPLVSMASTHVKKSVTGMGHAKKNQVQRMIQHEFSLKHLPEPPDVADALAVALSYAFNVKNNRSNARARMSS